MPGVEQTDRELLEDAAKLPGALYGARIYSMTALLALNAQRELYERQIADLEASLAASGFASVLRRIILHNHRAALVFLCLILALGGIYATASQRVVDFTSPSLTGRPAPAPTPALSTPPALIAAAVRAAPTHVAPESDVGQGKQVEPNVTAKSPAYKDSAAAKPASAAAIIEQRNPSPPRRVQVADAEPLRLAAAPPPSAAAVPLAVTSIPVFIDRRQKERQDAIDALRAIRAR